MTEPPDLVHRRVAPTPALLSPIVLLLTVVGLLSAGCAAQVPGAGSIPSSNASATQPCTDVLYADPSIAFEESLRDGDELATGDTGWISSGGSAADITVSGDSGVVTLTDRESPTEIACGTVRQTVSWIEVTAEKPGTATLELPGRTPGTISVTVT